MTKQLAQYSVPAENSRVIHCIPFVNVQRHGSGTRSALIKLFKGLQVKAASRGTTISLVDCVGGSQKMQKHARLFRNMPGKRSLTPGPFFIGYGRRPLWMVSPVMKIYLKLSMTAWNIVG